MTLEIYLNNTLVASKTCSITNVGDSDSVSHTCGSISVTYAERYNYRDYNDQPSWQQRYTETDTPNRGYKIVRRVLEYSGTGSGTPPDDDTTFPSPFIYPDKRQDNNVNEYFNVRNPNGTWAATIRIYIERVPRTPTNLLVNSYNRTGTVRLTYDQTTNKLVADY